MQRTSANVIAAVAAVVLLAIGAVSLVIAVTHRPPAPPQIEAPAATAQPQVITSYSPLAVPSPS